MAVAKGTLGRRGFLGSALLGPALVSAQTGHAEAAREPVPLLANDFVTVFDSPDPKKVYAFSPGITRLDNGRLVVTMDTGGDGVATLTDVPKDAKGNPWRGRIFTSDDRGKTWTLKGYTPLNHARPFVAGNSVYILGHRGDLGVVRSDDNGDTWSEASWLTQKQHWHQAPCNVHYMRGRIYLVMERKTDSSFDGWPVSVLAPVVLSADVNADLTQAASWVFSNELTFHDAIQQAGAPHLIGVPFFTTGDRKSVV